MITLKKAILENWELVQKIEGSVTGKFYSALKEEDDIKKYIENSHVFFIYDTDVVVGTISYEIKPEEYYIDGLVILPEFQGKNFGKAALLTLMDILGTDKKYSLVTHPHNTPAIIIYLKLGFVIDGWKENEFGDGEPRIHLVRNAE